MKIIKGSLKGKNIICPPHIRAVSLKVRKACFDILGEEVKGKSVLDLFAGSGALGIEALSLGAQRAVFVDINKRCAEAARKNIALLKLSSQAKVHLQDAFRRIREFSASRESFDIIFLDPPYYKRMLKKSLQTLEEYDILTPSAYIVCFCFTKDDFLEKSKNFSLVLSKKYGQTLLLIYKKILITTTI